MSMPTSMPGAWREGRGWTWRRGYAPAVVAMALLADYFSPAAMWTAALPLMFMAFLLCFRERNAALAVLFLSSWIFIPAAGAATWAVHAVRQTPRIYEVRVASPAAFREAGGVTEWTFPQDLDCTGGGVPVTFIEITGEGAVDRLELQLATTFAFVQNALTGASDLVCHER
jgi:hypothetical protein